MLSWYPHRRMANEPPGYLHMTLQEPLGTGFASTVKIAGRAKGTKVEPMESSS